MDNKDQHFIATTDEQTANLLWECGYYELPKEGNKWMFVNKGEIVFSSDDKMKVNYTNKLNF